MCALYAFMRVCDDLGDDPQASTDEKAGNLRDWRRQLHEALAGADRRLEKSGKRKVESGQSPIGNPHFAIPDSRAVFPALADVVGRYEIPRDYLCDVIDGVEADLQPREFETFEDLSHYCYQVAGAVGLCCLHVWGYRDDRAIPRAIDCGTAFQLTNILRDVGEDAAMGRVYLPREDLQRFQFTAGDLLARTCDDRFRRLMKFEVDRARDYYALAAQLREYLHPPGRPIFSAMLKTYRGLLDEIERRDYDVFARRISLSRWRKLRIALGAFVRHRLLRLGR